VSESRDEGQPGSSSSPSGSSPGTGGPSNASGTSSTNGQPRSGQPRSNQTRSSQPRSSQARSGGDAVADLQRWLMKAGARSMANQVADQVKRTMGQEKRRNTGDVWDTATTEMPPDEPPECQWCPVCQAARAARMSGPGLGERLAGAGGVLATLAADAFSAFEQAMKPQEQSQSSERAVVSPPRPTPPERGETGQ
jgi:hypothetical protein